MLDKVRQLKVCNVRSLALKFSVVQNSLPQANGLLNLFTTIKYYEAFVLPTKYYLAYNINISFVHR